MDYSQRIRVLKDRLHRLETNGRDNFGVRRKIRREIEFLEKSHCGPDLRSARSVFISLEIAFL